MLPRHKVFISCYYAEDGYYKELLENWNDSAEIFIDYSVQEYDIEDYGLTSEQIRRIIRDDYIRDSTVTIVLCGPNTRRRKHVDWEIHATMYDSSLNPQGGLIVINVPGSNNCKYASPGDENLVPGSYKYRTYHEIDWLNEHFPELPDRIFWNIQQGVPITIVDWDDVYLKNDKLSDLIDNAFYRKYENNYLKDIPLRKRNS